MTYVVIGLGNPGGEYAKTRHNAGRMAVERIAKLLGFSEFALKKTAQALLSEGVIDDSKVQLVLPEVYMNLSGKVIPSFVKSKTAARRLLIIRDELDMPLGTMKMTYGRGSGGHKGAESIMRALKTKDFAQIKIGISGTTAKGKLKKPGDEDKVIKHVIGKFKAEEELKLKKLFDKVTLAVEAFASDDIEKALLIANTK